MRDDPHVVALVTRASGGGQDAWYKLVDRYAARVYTICTRYRLSNHDIEDVGQNVWLLLVEQLGKLRARRVARLAGDDHRTRMPARRDGGE
jgi:DNA-directed RNA polymerase specialized sigma24 family protein